MGVYRGFANVKLEKGKEKPMSLVASMDSVMNDELQARLSSHAISKASPALRFEPVSRILKRCEEESLDISSQFSRQSR